jgi:hypothetical protein
MFRTVSIIALIVLAVWIVVKLRRGPREWVEFPKRQRLIYWIMVIGTIVAALTGIGSIIVGASPIGGWTLILHCLAAPLFAMGIAAIALLWAGRYMSNRNLPGCCSFWGMMIAGMIAIFSIAFTMTPLFAEQRFLLQVHRYSSLVLIFFMGLHAASLIAARRRTAA